MIMNNQPKNITCIKRAPVLSKRLFGYPSGDFFIQVRLYVDCLIQVGLYEPRREKTGFLHMRKQRRRSASR